MFLNLKTSFHNSIRHSFFYKRSIKLKTPFCNSLSKHTLRGGWTFIIVLLMQGDETIEGKVQAICLIDDYLGLSNFRVGLGALGAERIP